MKNTIIIVGIIVLLVVAGLLYRRTQPQNEPTLPSTSSSTSMSTGTPTPDTSALQAGGSSYADPKGVYTFLYPNDYKLDMQNNGQYTRIYKTGATQKGQTEMYDGVIMVFESIDLNKQSLEQWVDKNIEQSTADGTVELTKAKKAIKINDYSGFTYEVRGLGTSTYVVIQRESNSPHGVNINFAVNDPEQIGYESEVNEILQTLQLLK